jgi:hypothetical protein
MKFLLALAIVAVSVPMVSLAADQPGQKKERKLCKTIVKTGTHMEERLCLTPTQWQARMVDKGDDLDALMVQHKERGSTTGTIPSMSPH